MSSLSERAIQRLGKKLAGFVSRPGDHRYAERIAIWAKPGAERMPGAIAHCRNAADVQAAVRIARDYGYPLSALGGGHDWAGRGLCEGLVIDLGAMKQVTTDWPQSLAWVAGGTRAADLVRVLEPAGLAAVTGSVGAVGMAGLTLGGGYGPLIGRFGLALDNLLEAEIVLADGRAIVAIDDDKEDLLWALRGGGGNFGVVTAMRCHVHALPVVHSGLLAYPFSEARAVLQRCADLMASAPDELTVQIGVVAGPDGSLVVLIVPTWSGAPGDGEARTAPFTRLGTLLAGDVAAMSYRTSLTAFDPYLVNGLRTFIETCWIPGLNEDSIDILVHVMHTAISPGCAIVTHEFKGAASRVPAEATAFAMRQDHVLVEIVTACGGQPGLVEEVAHRQWALTARRAFEPVSFPGGYPNLLASDDLDRAAAGYGPNLARLIAAKRRYDPDNVFRSAIPLPCEGPALQDASSLSPAPRA